MKTKRETGVNRDLNELIIGITKSHPNKQENLLINGSNKEEPEALKSVNKRSMGDKYGMKMSNL